MSLESKEKRKRTIKKKNQTQNEARKNKALAVEKIIETFTAALEAINLKQFKIYMLTKLNLWL